ncbi:MAG: NAD(P)-binding protein [Candidatus Entotheonellia bacterium]
MRTEEVHTLIIGAGPAGLAAAYKLAKGGVLPILLEKDRVVGGMMRSIRRNQFILDIGRKELYSRIHEVDRLWAEILGSDYRPYLHRVGILYDGHIFEMSRTYRGWRRGMPWSILLACGVDYLWCRARSGASKPLHYQDYSYRTRGRRFSQVLSQEFEEKFSGKKWVAMPPPEGVTDGCDKGFSQSVIGRLGRAFRKDTPEPNWRHPLRGSGQICELLEKKILESGGRFHFGVRVTDLIAACGRIRAVRAEIDSEQVTYWPSHVVSSIQLEALAELLFPLRPKAAGRHSLTEDPPRRSTVLVYLFITEPPRFPHAWLNVTCPKTRAGRITNYAAFNGDMVPGGYTCLCVEYFCTGMDILLTRCNNELQQLATEECVRSRLVDPAKISDCLVLKLPGGDAAVHPRDWLSQTRSHLLAELNQFYNLYYVNRAGTDLATYAGLEAATAILSGDRSRFDQQADPTFSAW